MRSLQMINYCFSIRGGLRIGIFHFRLERKIPEDSKSRGLPIRIPKNPQNIFENLGIFIPGN